MQPYQMNGMAPYYNNYYAVPHPYGTMNYGSYPTYVPPRYNQPKQSLDRSPRKAEVDPHRNFHQPQPQYHPQYSQYPTHPNYPTDQYYDYQQQQQQQQQQQYHGHHGHHQQHRHHHHNHHKRHSPDRESTRRQDRFVRNNASQTTPTLLLDMMRADDQTTGRILTPVFMKEDLDPKLEAKRLTPEFLQVDFNDSISEYSTDDESRGDSAHMIDPTSTQPPYHSPPMNKQHQYRSPPPLISQTSKNKPSSVRLYENNNPRGGKTRR